MARVVSSNKQISHYLRVHHVVGRRSDTADLCISDPLVSRTHAALSWDGSHWSVRDLSRNGTWLNGSRIAAATPVLLGRGDSLCFGHKRAPAWELVDTSAPTAMLVGATADTPDIELRPFLFLPEDGDPRFIFHYSRQSGRWLVSRPADDAALLEERELRHGELLEHGGDRWRFLDVEVEHQTSLAEQDAETLADYEFIFDLSLDEEHTRLQLKKPSAEFDLGQRSHHYLLMHLARLRAEQAEAGVDRKNQGWVDNDMLARQIGVDITHLNILIYRARRQICSDALDTIESSTLVERRKGQVRFGCPRFKIFKGDSLACELQEHP